MKFLVLGGGAREHAIAATLKRAGAEVVVVSSNANPGLERIASASARIDPTDVARVVEFARKERVAIAVIGPEAPLAAGVADALRAAEVPTVGPSRDGARIESSKVFCRELLGRHGIAASPKVATPTTVDEVERAIAELGVPFVVKPDGLTAGKGVWVQGSDFTEPKEGAVYAKSLLLQGGRVLLEEKLDGEEFSQMAFVTDSGIYPMPAVQDFKRALEGNRAGTPGAWAHTPSATTSCRSSPPPTGTRRSRSSGGRSTHSARRGFPTAGSSTAGSCSPPGDRSWWSTTPVSGTPRGSTR